MAGGIGYIDDGTSSKKAGETQNDSSSSGTSKMAIRAPNVKYMPDGRKERIRVCSAKRKTTVVV